MVLCLSVRFYVYYIYYYIYIIHTEYQRDINYFSLYAIHMLIIIMCAQSVERTCIGTIHKIISFTTPNITTQLNLYVFGSILHINIKRNIPFFLLLLFVVSSALFSQSANNSFLALSQILMRVNMIPDSYCHEIMIEVIKYFAAKSEIRNKCFASSPSSSVARKAKRNRYISFWHFICHFNSHQNFNIPKERASRSKGASDTR